MFALSNFSNVPKILWNFWRVIVSKKGPIIFVTNKCGNYLSSKIPLSKSNFSRWSLKNCAGSTVPVPCHGSSLPPQRFLLPLLSSFPIPTHIISPILPALQQQKSSDGRRRRMTASSDLPTPLIVSVDRNWISVSKNPKPIEQTIKLVAKLDGWCAWDGWFCLLMLHPKTIHIANRNRSGI